MNRTGPSPSKQAHSIQATPSSSWLYLRYHHGCHCHCFPTHRLLQMGGDDLLLFPVASPAYACTARPLYHIHVDDIDIYYHWTNFFQSYRTEDARPSTDAVEHVSEPAEYRRSRCAVRLEQVTEWKDGWGLFPRQSHVGCRLTMVVAQGIHRNGHSGHKWQVHMALHRHNLEQTAGACPVSPRRLGTPSLILL